MKILQLASFFYPHIGGSENYVLELSRQLRRDGHEVLVMSSYLPGDQPHQRLDGVDVVRIPGIYLPEIPYFIFSPELIFSLLLLSTCFDVVHTHVRFFLSTNVASILKKLNHSFPLVITLHATYPSIRYSFLRPLKGIYDATMGRFTVNCADCVVALDENVRAHAISFGADPGKITIVPNGVDTASFSFWQRVSPDPVVVGFIGNLVKRKGVEYLMRGFEPIAREYGAILKIAGDGLEKGKLYKLRDELDLRGYVEFLGAIDREGVPAFFRGIDILVVPSLSDGMPTVMLEGMASGKAVIGTDVGAIPTVLNSERVGILVPPGDAGSITRAMAALIDDEGLRTSMGEAARTHIENSFSWERIAADIELLYQRVVGGRAVPADEERVHPPGFAHVSARWDGREGGVTHV